MKCQLSSSGRTRMTQAAFIVCCMHLQDGKPPGGYWVFNHKALVDNRRCGECRAGILVRAYFCCLAAGYPELANMVLAKLAPPLGLGFRYLVGMEVPSTIMPRGMREAYTYCRNIEWRYMKTPAQKEQV